MNSKKSSEEFVLLGQYLVGDEEAGEILFSSIYLQVKHYVFSKTNQDSYFDEFDKEDIIVEAMIRSIDKQHLFNGSSAFSTFVIGFAKNVIYEERRKRYKDIKNVVELEPLDRLETIHTVDLYRNPLGIIIKQEQIEALNQAIEMLTEAQMQILKLRIFNKMSFKDIVQFTGKSEAAVDSLFRRAVAACKRNFENIYY